MDLQPLYIWAYHRAEELREQRFQDNPTLQSFKEESPEEAVEALLAWSQEHIPKRAALMVKLE